MAFDSLSEKLQSVMKKLTGRGKLNEQDVKAAMREVRMALLEADVNFGVAKDFCSRVSQKAVGEEILKSLTPGQQVVKLVRDELIELIESKKPGEVVKVKISRDGEYMELDVTMTEASE